MSATTVLVVEDDPTSLATLRGLLESDGYEVVVASTGEEAVEKAAGDGFIDLILLDVVLPGMDGVETCRQLKNNDKTARIPIVLVSGVRTDDTSIREGLDAGADGYLLKPVEPIALRAWLKATLRISELQREAARRAFPVETTDEELLRTFANLSHDVNNPLQALYARVDILMMDLPQDSEARALAVAILAHAEKVASMVAQASLQAKEHLED